ncbi:hypothetical protein ACFQZS_15895 [Mucilaginibacter calamicampi]|uniref:Uncharacterized protein n=1 Tax=Mucilaginibacter calamicampi TaxID=1302352 RepID=A0ABW2YYR5_9SPHI
MTEPVINDQSAYISPKYFSKSKGFYRYSAYIFLWVILYPQIAKAIWPSGIMDAFFMAIPTLALYIITPVGIFYSIKSYTAKEPYNKYRAFYLFGHLFFLFILMALALSFYADLLTYSNSYSIK